MSFKALDDIAFMLIESRCEFADCSLESVKEVIKRTIEEVCVDKRIFDSDSVVFRKYKNLFDCKSADSTVNEFTSIIIEEISMNLKNSFFDWCTAYVAPRISGASFILEKERLYAINKNDVATWNDVVCKRYLTNGWFPITAECIGNERTFLSGLNYNYVFLSGSHGTQSDSRFASCLKLMRLFSVMFSVISKKSSFRLMKVLAQPYSHCLPFPELAARRGIGMSGIGALVPYYGVDHVLNSDEINGIKNWFELVEKLDKERSDRIGKCAHFINRAMNSEDIESYVNYFVALDALFGIRGSVEKTIVDGVKSLQLGERYDEKISWLFDLRNELVHGGSRYIKEWKKYYRYYIHFDSEPDVDMGKIAFSALLNYPEIFK
jgi:Apea-like HEPN